MSSDMITIMINKHTGEVIVDGANPCSLCAKNAECDKSQLRDCFVPCG